jgi:hypothetical protein
MSIKQFNGEWVSKEDRVLFRFNTTHEQEFSFWLTRFVVKGLIQGSQQMAVQVLAKAHPAPVAQVMQTFQQEAVTQKLNFKETYQAAKEQPLGTAPLLVTGLAMNQDGDAVTLRLDVENGQCVTVQMAASTLQVMLALLDKLQATANWGVGFADLEGQNASPAPIAPSTLVH